MNLAFLCGIRVYTENVHSWWWNQCSFCYRGVSAPRRNLKLVSAPMLRSAFSVASLGRAVRSGDSHRFGQNLKDDGPTIIAAISVQAISRSVQFTGFVRAKVRKKYCFVYKAYAINLVLRTIATYLARRFRVVPPNRDRIVHGVVEAMMDATPFTIIRRDITSFYESIDADALRTRLIYDTSIPRVIRHYLALFFETLCPNGRGLPRGIGLTAVLVEMAMEKFDQQVRAIPGVYRYFRYSDDVVIFAYANVSEIQSSLLSLLPAGMHYNESKSAVVDFTRKDEGTEKSFEYLGYRLYTAAGVGGKTPRPVHVSISTAKVNRLKSRVILSLKAFRKDHDGALLLDRLRLLSSNFQINRHGASAWLRGKRVRSGIFYNYRRCGTYESLEHTEVVPPELSALDTFTHTLLKSRRSEFRPAIVQFLTHAQKQQLATISFRLGFKSRRLIRLPYARLSLVKAAWRNG